MKIRVGPAINIIATILSLGTASSAFSQDLPAEQSAEQPSTTNLPPVIRTRAISRPASANTAIDAPLSPAVLAIGPAPAAKAGTTMSPKEARQFDKATRQDNINCLIREKITSEKKLLETLAICDKLLGNPVTADTEPNMRASLLQQRALLLINLGRFDLADDALTESNDIAAKSPDILFDQSIGIGNKFLKSYILHHNGETDKARSLLDEARRQRPYSETIQSTADTLENGYEDNFQAVIDRYTKRTSYDPDIKRRLMDIYFLAGDVENAAKVGNQVSLINPKTRSFWRSQDEDNSFSQILAEIELLSKRAYFAYLLNDTNLSNSLFAEADEAIAEYLGDDPSKGEKKPSKSAVKKYMSRLGETDILKNSVADRKALINLRDNLAGKTLKDIWPDGTSLRQKVALIPAYVEILQHWKKNYQSPTAPDTVTEAEAADIKLNELLIDNILKIFGPPSLVKFFQVKPENLGSLLPPLETFAQIKEPSSLGFLHFEGATRFGYSRKKEADSQIESIEYEAGIGTPALVEETLFVAIADIAEKEGNDSFIIFSNRTVKQFLSYGYGKRYPAGYQALARILMFNSANPPAEALKEGVEIFSIADIRRDLTSKYDALLAQKKEKRNSSKK